MDLLLLELWVILQNRNEKGEKAFGLLPQTKTKTGESDGTRGFHSRPFDWTQQSCLTFGTSWENPEFGRWPTSSCAMGLRGDDTGQLWKDVVLRQWSILLNLTTAYAGQSHWRRGTRRLR
jgi:hypothetical protein